MIKVVGGEAAHQYYTNPSLDWCFLLTFYVKYAIIKRVTFSKEQEIEMFFKHLTAVLATLATFCFLGGTAGAMTLQQLERCWGATENVSGTFQQFNADRTVSTGTYRINNPGRMSQTYRDGLVVSISGQSMHINDPKGANQTYPLGGMSHVFRRAANLRTGAVTHQGALPGGGIKIRLVDTSGRVSGHSWIHFNGNCRMILWEIEQNGQKTTTQFN